MYLRLNLSQLDRKSGPGKKTLIGEEDIESGKAKRIKIEDDNYNLLWPNE